MTIDVDNCEFLVVSYVSYVRRHFHTKHFYRIIQFDRSIVLKTILCLIKMQIPLISGLIMSAPTIYPRRENVEDGERSIS